MKRVIYYDAGSLTGVVGQDVNPDQPSGQIDPANPFGRCSTNCFRLDSQTTLVASNNITITAAQNSETSSSFREEKKSGLGAMGGLSYGKREQSTDQQNQRTTAAATCQIQGPHPEPAAGSLVRKMASRRSQLHPEDAAPSRSGSHPNGMSEYLT